MSHKFEIPDKRRTDEKPVLNTGVADEPPAEVDSDAEPLQVDGTLPIVIEVTEPRGIGLPPDPDGMVRIIDSGSETGYRNVLAPGENEVEFPYWESVCKRNGSVQNMLTAGLLVIRGRGRAKPADELWNECTEKRLNEILEGLDDIAKIQQIKSKIKRKNLIKLCSDRVRVILSKVEAV